MDYVFIKHEDLNLNFLQIQDLNFLQWLAKCLDYRSQLAAC